MMTLAQMRTMQADLLQLDRNYRGADPTKGDQNAQLNQAYRIIASKCSLVGDVSLTLTAGVSTYNVRDVTTPIVGAKMIRPLTVYINQIPLRDASQRDFGFWTYDELARYAPNWKGDAQGVPWVAILMSWKNLVLYPTPSAQAAAYTNSVYGQYLPNDLALDADSPDLPEEIHEAIPWLAAQLAMTPTISAADAFQRLAQYQQFWTQIIQQVADENQRRMQDWGSVQGWHDDDYILT